MKHYEPKHIAALSDRGFYTILTVCGLIIAASAWVLWMHAGSSAETAVPETGAPVITPAEESKTQVAVNSQGKTNEATKGLKEPLEQGQTQPKPEQKKKSGQKL